MVLLTASCSTVLMFLKALPMVWTCAVPVSVYCKCSIFPLRLKTEDTLSASHCSSPGISQTSTNTQGFVRHHLLGTGGGGGGEFSLGPCHSAFFSILSRLLDIHLYNSKFKTCKKGCSQPLSRHLKRHTKCCSCVLG